MRQCCEEPPSRGAGVRTIHYVHATLRAGLEDAVWEELLEQNIAKLASTRQHRLHALFVVLGVLALRRSEAFGLKWRTSISTQ